MFQENINFSNLFLKNINSHFEKDRSKPLLYQGLAFVISGTLASAIPFAEESAEKKFNCPEESSLRFRSPIEFVDSVDDTRISRQCRVINFSGNLLAIFFWVFSTIFVSLVLANLIYIPIVSFVKTLRQTKVLFKQYKHRKLSSKEYFEYKEQNGKGFVVSILGISGTGKTLFRTNLITLDEDNIQREPDVTTEMEAVVISSKRDGSSYTVFDLPGNEEREQFKVITESNILVVFLDHNYPKRELNEPEKKRIDDSRLREHEVFLVKLKKEIERINHKNDKTHLRVIFFVLNKSDLWNPDLWMQESTLLRFMTGKDRPSKLKSWASNLVNDWKREVAPKLADRIVLIDSFSNLYSSEVRDLEARVLDSHENHQKA